MMDTSTASVNSALAAGPPDRRGEGSRHAASSRPCARSDDARLREVVAGYSAALERGDADALVALLTEDVTWSMPPLPHWYRGLDAVTDFAVRAPADPLRLLAAPADQRQRPARGGLLPVDDGARQHLPGRSTC